MKNILFIFFLGVAQCVAGQTTLPVINANTNRVLIRDGNHVTINGWKLDPGLKPDTYYVNIPGRPGKVSFMTDVDSMSFNTQYGQTYDFIILLNGRDSCYIRISANYHDVISPERVGPGNSGPDMIPFTMRGSRIYFNGKVNGHSDITIQFDLGAGGSCVNKGSVTETGVKFDGKTTLINSDGSNEAPVSSNNTLQIAGLKWTGVPLVQSENMGYSEDLIIGNSLFADKVIEIDYDNKVMLVHDQLPRNLRGYSSQEVIYEQHRPMVQASVMFDGGERYTDWFLFDTGRDGTMLIAEDFVNRYDLWNRFNTIFNMGKKKLVRLREVRLGTLKFRNIVTDAANPATPSGRQSLLGNELLDHFNVVLDNRHGMIYLKPNSLQDNPYSDWHSFKTACKWVISLTLIGIGVLIVWVMKWKERRNSGYEAEGQL